VPFGLQDVCFSGPSSCAEWGSQCVLVCGVLAGWLAGWMCCACLILAGVLGAATPVLKQLQARCVSLRCVSLSCVSSSSKRRFVVKFASAFDHLMRHLIT
jgi:hypothetical protein